MLRPRSSAARACCGFAVVVATVFLTVAAPASAVDPAPTTTSITSDLPDPSVPGEDVTVQYTVSGPGTVLGNVVVTDSLGDDSCSASVAAGQCTLDDLTTEGTHTLIATYTSSTANHNGSTSAGVSHLVDKLGTTTIIDSDTPDPSLIGTAVDVDYTVLGAGTPTGNVTVSDGVDSCVGTVAAGTCDITLTTAGARTLTAVYEGDSTHDGSTSADESHLVNSAPTIEVLAGGRCNSTTLATVKLLINDPDGDALTVTAVTSNALVATGALGGTNPNRTLAVTAKRLGTATITVATSDGNGGSASVVVTVHVGGNGADVITGAAGTDVIFGVNGADTLSGGGAADYLCSGNGTGTSSGGTGNDTIDGQNGDDILRGDDGDDFLTGGKGNDRFFGGDGTDTFTDVAKGESTDGP